MLIVEDVRPSEMWTCLSQAPWNDSDSSNDINVNSNDSNSNSNSNSKTYLW